jgi:carboxymethylenebutenolidase
MEDAMERPKITQAMIDAYDEYTHLTLDRRGFMEKLSKLAGSGAAAAAIAPMLAANSARAAIVPEDDQRLKAEDITYPGAEGEMKGYLVQPADAAGKLGAVIVIHENRGLNAHIKDLARRIALEGFVALAPDFLSPQGGTPADEDKAREMFSSLDAAKTAANGVATVEFLKNSEATNGKVGAVGFCWGGGTVNNLAIASPDLAAGVAYYGAQPKDTAAIASIKAPLLLHYAGSGRAHQCRHRRLQGGARCGRARNTPSTSTKGRSTPSTTTRRKPATTRKRPILHGEGLWLSSRKSYPRAFQGYPETVLFVRWRDDPREGRCRSYRGYGQIRPTKRASASGKPFGPGAFGPFPSAFGSAVAPPRPSPKPSTLGPNALRQNDSG